MPDGTDADVDDRSPLPSTWPRVQLAGSVADLLGLDDAVGLIAAHAHRGHDQALGVVSLNLDHIHHFGSANAATRELRRDVVDASLDGDVRWLALLDGAPLVRRANELTGRRWPRLAGSDLIGPILERAEVEGLSVGFLGGAATTHAELLPILARDYPRLRVAGCWAPERSELSDPVAAAALTEQIRDAGVDVLAVCLGKPRQEQWIAEHGFASGAPVHLAFGAVVDFLAGRVNRSPRWVADHGLEWAWRLAMEPKRLARRYLVQGPPSYWALQRDSYVKEAVPFFAEPSTSAIPTAEPEPVSGHFTGPDGYADVAVVVVTYNNGEDVEPLIDSLRLQLGDSSIRVVIADNGSADDTLEAVRRHPDVIALPTGGNLGYAGGINAARRVVGRTGAVLVLNPDLALAPGAVKAMRDRLAETGVGAVVPRLLEADGLLYPSLRYEPTLLRAVGDALLGSRLGGRPVSLSEIEQDPARYRTAHEVDWATGAAIMVDAAVERQVGEWDEQFFLYSEEIDYARRVRQTGAAVWFEPEATMEHRRGGSGASDQLEALMAVNRVRYQEKWHGRARSTPYRAVVTLASLLRVNQSRHRTALGYLVRRDRWDELPAAVPAAVERTSRGAGPVVSAPGAIIIPAHDEAAVIERTLAPLAPLIARGTEVLVAPNGCTDATAEIAAAVPGVRVVDVPVASKVAALNAADDVATAFPRLYLDADITVAPEAVEAVFAALARPGVLAARPAFRYDTAGADPAVRAYYRARGRIPAMHEHLWGAGAYALNEAGHERLGRFPDVTGDDLYVDQLFSADEIVVVDTAPTQVRVPRTTSALLNTLGRVYRGNSAIAGSRTADAPATDPAGGLKPLLRGVRGPLSLADAGVYAGFAVTARVLGRRRTAHWQRDETNRVAAEPAGAPVTSGDVGRVDHVVLTRFNVPSAGVESLIRAKEGWLRGRVALFEQYTVPAMDGQDTAYTWIIYFDPESPTWLKEWLQPYADRGLFVPVFRESVSHDELVQDIREHTPRGADVVVTTNLDNDDGLAHDFLSRIQAAPVPSLPSAVYLVDGLIVRGDDLFARTDLHNAFCSVRESWDGDLRTCWADWHNRLALQMPAVEQRGEPAWLQVIHGTNVSNRVNGTRVSPERYRSRFAPLLDETAAPDRWSLVRDRYVDRPRRFVRESVRANAKKAVLTVGGTGGLDRLKEVLGARRSDKEETR